MACPAAANLQAAALHLALASDMPRAEAIRMLGAMAVTVGQPWRPASSARTAADVEALWRAAFDAVHTDDAPAAPATPWKQQLNKLGVPGFSVPHPSVSAVGLMAHGRFLSAETRLPGVAGAPYVGTTYEYDDVVRVREVPDLDRPRHPTAREMNPLYGGIPVLGTIYPTKRVETTERKSRAVLSRQDTPIWPLDARA